MLSDSPKEDQQQIKAAIPSIRTPVMVQTTDQEHVYAEQRIVQGQEQATYIGSM